MYNEGNGRASECNDGGKEGKAKERGKPLVRRGEESRGEERRREEEKDR